ncbi:MAG: LysM peptidoglycan-binding domain-containing protein, partial [Bacteroides sp.]|nr:LysM peptidoglycan-binding domain-containing protein [Bacteroides sp.]
ELEIKIIGEEEEEQKEDEILTVSESDLTVLEKLSVEKESVILEVPIASGEKTVLEEGIQEKEKISSVQEKEPIVSEDKTFSEEVGEVKNLEDSIVIKEEKKKTDIMSFFVGIMVSAVVLCGVTIAFVYSPDLMNKAMGKPFEDELVEVEDCDKSDSIGAYNTLTEEIILEDSQDSARDTILEISVNASAVTEPETQVQMIVEPSVPNYDNSYEIVGTKTTYTIKEGDMLTRIALHYYGTKLLWPYIVKHNPTVIKNPNNVPCGTTIKIPKLIKKQ